MKTVQVWMRFWDKVAESLLIIVTAPYYLLFLRNTKGPIFEVVRASREDEVAQKITEWLKAKRREAIYIQAAVSAYKPPDPVSLYQYVSTGRCDVLDSNGHAPMA